MMILFKRFFCNTARRNLIGACSFFLFYPLLSLAQPNIVLIMADDMAADETRSSSNHHSRHRIPPSDFDPIPIGTVTVDPW